jgi:ankyrin repeat protein
MYEPFMRPPRALRISAALLGVAVTAVLLSGCTPSLHDVIGRGDVEAARAMLQENPDLAAAENELGKQPLQYAVSYRQQDAMEALLEAGGDVNAADHTGMTALHAAALLGWQDGTRWLLAHGADRNKADHFGDLPSHIAAIHGQGGIIKILFEDGDPLTQKNTAGKTPLDLARKHRKERAAQFIEKLIAGG